MTEHHGGYKYSHDGGAHKHPHEAESASVPHEAHKSMKKYDWEEFDYESYSVDWDESEPVQPKISYVPYQIGIHKEIKKVKKTKYKKHHPAYVAAHPMHKKCAPIVCDPQYIVRNCYVPREVPVVHPIVHVNRNIIVNVPKHYYQPMTKNEVVDPGCPGSSCHPHPKC